MRGKRTVTSVSLILSVLLTLAIAAVSSFATNQPQGVEINPTGLSRISWMFETTQDDWVNTKSMGIDGHEGDDYYADDWARAATNELTGEQRTFGQIVYAGISGVAIAKSDHGEYGNDVIIYDSESKFALRNAHLSEILVGDGEEVSAGSPIGKVGDSGNALRPHLHIALYKNVRDVNDRPITRITFNRGNLPTTIPGPATDLAAPFLYNPRVKPGETPADTGVVWEAGLPEGPVARLGIANILDIAFSPDGSMLAVATSFDIALYNPITYAEIGYLYTGVKVNSIFFSPNGRLLASAGENSLVKLWDVHKRQEIATLPGHSGPVHSVAFSPGGSLLASAGADKRIKLWDIATLREVTTFIGHSDTVRCVAFSPTGGLVASGSSDKTVKLWNILKQQEIATLSGHLSGVYSVAFSPDGSLLASSSNNVVKLWDVASQKEAATFWHSSPVYAVSFSPDGRLLASGSSDKTVKLWDVVKLQEVATLSGHSSEVYAVAFSPNGSLLASGSGDKTVKLWDVVKLQEVATLSGHSNTVYAVAFSPDGRLLASGSWDATIKLWDVVKRQEEATFARHSSAVCSVAFSPDGRLLASGSSDRTIKLWDISKSFKRQEIATLPGHTGTVWSVAFSPDGTILASGSGSPDNTIKLWNVASQKEVATLKGHSNSVNSVTFSPDGSLLASGSADSTIKLCNVASQKEVATLKGHSNWVRSVTFSPDGKLVVSGSDDGTTKVWDVASCQEEATLPGHSGSVHSVAFSPDGSLLVSGSADTTILLWDVMSLQLPHPVSQPPVAAFSFSPESPAVNKEINFDASCWYDQNGEIIFYEWNFGDNSQGIGKTITHLYSVEGRYLVTLKVTDNEGESATVSREIMVVLPAQPQIQVEAQSHSYKEVMVGESADWILAISNIGDGNLKISGVTPGLSVFTIAAPGFPQNIPAGGTLEVTIRFAPDEEKSYLNFLVITSNSVDKPELYILLDGKGVRPNTVALQNYPNPFNPETWIPYQLAKESEVVIRIFTAGGRLIQTLELGAKPAGLHVSKDRAAYWDGRDESGESVASGVYFYCLQAGNFSETKKMVIAR